MRRCLLPRDARPLTTVHLVARLHVDLLRLAGALCRR
ncbi:putative leader peptide [Actinomycetospora sp. CA-101289]